MHPTPFSTMELQTLAQQDGGPLVSLLAPMHTAGRDRREDPIRVRNLLRTAERELKSRGCAPAEVDRTLAPARGLLEERDFWEAGHPAAAIFLGPDDARCYTPPIDLPEQVVVGDRFEISPLLPALTDGGPFYVLGLAGNGWRLLQCTRWASARLDIPGAPANEQEALEVVEPTPSLQHHTADRPSGDLKDVFHGQGVGDDDRKDHLRFYYRQLDHALCDRLRGLPGPLVVAATESRFAVYRDLSDHPNLVKQPILGAPDVAADDRLRQQAWEIVAPLYDQSRRQAAEAYRELSSKGRATAHLPEALEAADHGRLETVFARAGEPVWGKRSGGDGGQLEIHQQRQPGDVDLLNEAVALALLRGSAAYLAQPEEMPGGQTDAINAVLRW